MLNNKTIAVVVPAYNEETQIGMVIETMPEFVDRIVIVNDKSTDKTVEVVTKHLDENKPSDVVIKEFENKVENNLYNEAELVYEQIRTAEADKMTPSVIANNNPDSERVILINHSENAGVGAAIATGYMWCRNHRIDCTAVMAGDGQMDPSELLSICEPVINENIDYVKGNRLIHKAAHIVVPKSRYFGNSVLSMLTKVASGYWHVSDTQTGYTAISLSALESIDIPGIYKSYGMPNDMLVKLNIAYCTIREVPIKPVYRVGEKSKMKIGKVIPRLSLLLVRLFLKRLWTKYFFRDFHPVFLFYNFSFLTGLISIPFLVNIIYVLVTSGRATTQGIYTAFILLALASLQSLGFAMWMDITSNERLNK
jgi:glycosyltransferase involved in cell wall biosynthesis